MNNNDKGLFGQYPREQAPKEAAPKKQPKAEKPDLPSWAIRDPKKIYFSHRQYPACAEHPPLVFEYVGPLFYPNGDRVRDFVSVRAINDLGLRGYLAGAYCTAMKSLCSPYMGELPDPYWRPKAPIRPKSPAPSSRINKTAINPKRTK